MYRKFLYSLLAVIALSSFTVGQVKDTVTFRVQMKIKILKGLFASASDSVWVAGNFNNWNSKGALLTFNASDSTASNQVIVDTSTYHPGNDTIFYKFTLVHPAGGAVSYEGGSNRAYKLVNGSHVIPTVYFDRDSVYTPSVPVTFKVNMSIKWREGIFRPDLGDAVTVPGDLNGWNTSTDTLKKGTSDSIYTVTRLISQGSTVHYKFYKNTRGGLDWEGNQSTGSGNREYVVPNGGGTIPTVWFDNDSVFVSTVTTNMLFQTDMGAYTQIGWFNPTKDTVEVRGSFTGWSGQAAASDQFVASRWAKTAQGQILPVNSQVQYKFYMRMDSASAFTRFGSDYNSNKDGYGYEHPAERGDGNDVYSVQNLPNQTVPMSWFAGINPSGLLKNTTDSVTVTLKVNMGPATRYSNAFSLAADTLYVVWQDALWRGAQAKIQGTFASTMKMTRQGPSDSVFTLQFKVKGKAHYNMQYTYRYKKADGSSVDQGGGLGGQNPFITRFIHATSPNVWPATYTPPTDSWQKDPPLPGETAQYTTGVGTSPSGPPESYTLFQNYPNPFNPTTYIKYALPQQTNVRLRVYNLLGQQIAELVNTSQQAGDHIVAFDAHALATGVYFYKLEAGTFSQIKKMLLLK